MALAVNLYNLLHGSSTESSHRVLRIDYETITHLYKVCKLGSPKNVKIPHVKRVIDSVI